MMEKNFVIAIIDVNLSHIHLKCLSGDILLIIHYILGNHLCRFTCTISFWGYIFYFFHFLCFVVTLGSAQTYAGLCNQDHNWLGLGDNLDCTNWTTIPPARDFNLYNFIPSTF